MNDEIKKLYLKALAKKHWRDLKTRKRLVIPYIERLPPANLNPEKEIELVNCDYIYLEVNSYHEEGFPIVRGRMPDDKQWHNLWVELL